MHIAQPASAVNLYIFVVGTSEGRYMVTPSPVPGLGGLKRPTDDPMPNQQRKMTASEFMARSQLLPGPGS